MAKRKRYDDRFRASAVVMLEAAGYPDRKGALMQVAKHVGVPHPTLSRWFNRERNPAPNDLVHEKKRDLIDMLATELEAIFGDMPSARKDASYRDLGTVAGILMDKKQLLEGKPTERTESTSKVEHDIGENTIDRFAEIYNILQGVGAIDPATPDSTPNP